MSKQNKFRRIIFTLMMLLMLSVSFGNAVFALDNTDTIGSGTTDTVDAFYYSDQYMWKVSLFVANADTVNRNDSTIQNFHRIGDEAVYLTPVGNWNQWVGGSRPSHISSLAFSKENKVDTLMELDKIEGDINDLNPVSLTNAVGVDIINFGSIVCDGKTLPYPPQICDGMIYKNGVIEKTSYVGNLNDVVNYFNNQKTINAVLNHYATKQGKTPEQLVSELEFTINGETRTGWNPEGILPKEINGNPTNQVEWLIVYEPCAIVYTRDTSKWKETDQWYNGYVLSATDFSVMQIKKQMDWRYDETRMSSWAGKQPDAWLPNAQRQHVARLSHLVVGNSVIIKDAWYGYEVGKGVDQNAAVPYNRWTSENQLKFGGWGMSMWEKPTIYKEAIDYDFNENTDVIYATNIYSNIDTVPGDELTVTYEINGGTYTNTVIAPKKTEVLSYFKWHTPEVDTPTTYDLKITVSPYPKGTIGADGNEYVHKTITVRPLVEKTPPDPKVHDSLPTDFIKDNVPDLVVGDDTIKKTDTPIVKEVQEVSKAPYYYDQKVTLNIITNRATQAIDFKNTKTGDSRQLTKDSVGNGILVSTFENKLDDTITWQVEFTMINFGKNTYSVVPSSAEKGLGSEFQYSLDMIEDPDIPVINSVDINPKPDAKGFYYLYTDTKSPDLEYMIYYNTDGGTKIEPHKVKANTFLPVPEVPEKEGYIFSGWYKDNNFSELWDFDNTRIRGVSTLYAKWTIKTFTVCFENNGKGNTISPITVNYNEIIPEPEKLAQNGFRFEGWFKDSGLTEKWDFDNSTITQDTTLYAKWSANEFLVGFEENGGTEVADQVIKYNEKVTEPTISHEGYTFDKWCIDAELTTPWNFETDTVTKNMVLYAKWIADPSAIYFVENGGSDTPDLIGVTDQNITDRTMPIITREGYTFKGFFLEEDFSGDEVTELPEKFPIGELTYYAKWEINIYTVTFDTDEGSSIDEQQVEYQQLATRPKDDPEKNGFYFKTWYADKELTEVFDFDAPITGDTTIYARWLGPDDDISEYTPGQIGEIAEKGEGDDYFDVGDEITIELSTGEQVVMQIYGFDHDFKSDGGKTDITFGTKNLLLDSGVINTADYNVGGWDSSALRSWMRTTLYDELPSEWQILIYGVDKTTSDGGLTNSLTVSSDKIYAFSEKELTGNQSLSLSGEGRKYPIFDMGTIVKTQNGSATDYWTRSATVESGSAFNAIGLDTSISSIDANQDLGIAFGFSIGTAKHYTVSFDTTGANETVDSQTIDDNSLATDPNITLSRDDGYFFDKWFKDVGCTVPFDFYNDYINSDTILYAGWKTMPPKGSPLSDFTWEQIGIIADAGQGDDYWDVGAEKDLTLTTGETLTMQIYGFNHDPKSDGSGDTNITFGCKDLGSSLFKPMNFSGTNVGGWNSSNLRSTTNGILFDQLGHSVKSIVKTVDKMTSTGGYGSPAIIASADNVFIFSAAEIGVVSSYAVVGEGTQYPIFTDNISRIRSGSQYWLRSAQKDTDSYFLGVLSSGAVSTNFGASQTQYGNFGFAVGSSPYADVTYNTNGGSSTAAQKILKGTTIPAPTVPTKANYAFGGWFKDASFTTPWNFATDTITGQTTLYAKWQAQVTFNSQGGSAVSSVTTDLNTYISAPSSPSRDGYTFKGWFNEAGCLSAFNFATTPVTANKILYAKWDLGVPDSSVPLNDWSWEQIKIVADAGLGQSYFDVGEYKDITLSTGEVLRLQIYGFNHDELADGTGNKTNITFGLKTVMNANHVLNPTNHNDNYGGWDVTDMRAYLNGVTTSYQSCDYSNTSVYSTLSSDLKPLIKQVKKYTSRGFDNQYPAVIIISVDKLFLFSDEEVYQNNDYSAAGEGTLYPIFNIDNASRIRKDVIGNTRQWWLRSASFMNSAYYFGVNFDGYATNIHTPECPIGVNFGFAIGNAPTNTYNVTFDSQGGSAVAAKTATMNTTITAPTEPTKTNAFFGGWFKDAACTQSWIFTSDKVTGTTTIYAKWTDLPPAGQPLESYTWPQIKQISEAGKADDYWNIGDEKIVNIGGTNYAFQIYDFKHDDKADGSGKVGITFGMKGVYKDPHSMNAFGVMNSAGYNGSDLRAYLNGVTTINQLSNYTTTSVYYKLPSDLKSVVSQVKKYTSDNYLGASQTVTSIDNLFIFGTIEVFGYSSYSWTDPYSYQYPIFTDNASRIKRDSSSNPCVWHLRDQRFQDSYSFLQVDVPGNITNVADWNYGVCFGFCV